MKKNDIVKLNIVDMTHDGLGVGKVFESNDTRTFFVKDGLVGDVVKAIITKNKTNVFYAKVLEIIEKSPYRVKSKCAVSDKCGGCQLLNLLYEMQLELKQKIFINNLQRLANIKYDIIEKTYEGIEKMTHPCHFRNKIQIPFSMRENKIICGFYAGRTHYIIENDFCMTGFKNVEIFTDIIKQFLTSHNITIYNEETNEGIFRSVLFRRANSTNEMSVTFVVNDKNYKKNLKNYEALANEIVNYKKYLDEKEITINKKQKLVEGRNDLYDELCVKTVSLNINTEKNNVLLSQDNITIYGEGYINDEILDTKFKISTISFYQVNIEMTKKLYKTVIDFCDIKNTDNILDLYCGIGTMTLIASKKAKYVMGIEVIKKAIDDANINKEINNITNVEFVCADAEILSNEALNDDTVYKNLFGKKFDTIIIDPPRKGLDDNTKQLILKIAPQKIVYVSCDSATLSRDLKYLLNDNLYKIEKMKLVDMFAHTMHMEAVVLLTKI